MSAIRASLPGSTSTTRMVLGSRFVRSVAFSGLKSTTSKPTLSQKWKVSVLVSGSRTAITSETDMERNCFAPGRSSRLKSM